MLNQRQLPHGSVFVFQNKDGLYFKGLSRNQDKILFTRDIKKAVHVHYYLGATHYMQEFEKVGEEIRLLIVPAFCGYCSG